ncbi:MULTISPECIES: MFS transporter [Burkholderiaceae]|uniref:MFS transporter permease n=1 Tax=Caballeronia zhejiangensis TaxID=871203 RepID=A0A656QD30_9BURK|nr:MULTISPECIES: MFS transporter [Burkholderiaceae]KAK43548.1 MFS transporter permease [Caballeronia jiangsuensis]KDR26097.1 MFS transporter permease [Caballeronia zhejiangensis]KWU24282.1 MFS transporter permease [Burkholderia cenocepacia]SAL77634.1 major facilitator transporter [Caballeronia peredens]
MQGKEWDTSYEWKAVTLLALGFGLVGLDRWLIAPLFPSIMKDLGLTAQDVGNCIGILGLSWGVFAIIMGGLSDKIGRRKVLIPSIIAFSLLSGFSGVSGGLASLLAIRALMGVAEGSFCPTSFAATADASHAKRRGFNLGLQQSGFALFGLALAPIIATQLLGVMSWRWVFALVAVPGLILGLLMYVVIREPKTQQVTESEFPTRAGSWKDVIKSRNVMLAMIALFCAMTAVFVLGAMLPLYLTQYLMLDMRSMGFVASAIGFGGFFGQFGLPGISDIIGRRTAGIIGFVATAFMLFFFRGIGAQPVLLFAVLFVISFFTLGLVALLSGPIATEAAPAGMVSTSIGLVVGAGEIFGGGVAPALAGFVATHFGIHNIVWLPIYGVLLGFLVCLFLVETAPKRARQIKQTFPAVELPQQE